MRSKAESVRLAMTAAGLALAALAASPAIKTSGNGLSLAADAPPAVAQPAGAASAPAPGDSSGATTATAPAPGNASGATTATTPAPGNASLPQPAGSPAQGISTGAQPVAAAAAPAPADTVGDDLMYHRETYMYASSNLRDPFSSLVAGNFIADNASRLPDIGSIELLGVMWGDMDRFAMLEDKEGNSYVLRVGDPVVNGEVSAITRDSITIRQYFFGSSTSVTLKLKPREGKADAKKLR